MSGLYTHTARNDGESIDETKYNADHQNHIDNHIPEMMDDYSGNATEMQSETDPGESGSESLPTSLAGELERLRYAIRELKGTTYWYESAATNLNEVTRRNFLINGDFSVWQLGTSFTAATAIANNDTATVADCWRLLSDGNDIVDVSAAETGPSEADTSLKAEVATANAKFGFLQIVEGRDTIKFSQGSQKASLSFYARTNTGSTTTRLRAAIVEWTSTEDDPTLDIVSAWEAQGTNPTLVSNWAYVSTPSTLTLTTTMTEFTVTNVNISDSANNIGVFIWVDDTSTTVTDEVHLAAAQLVRGGGVGVFTAEPWIETLRKCQRRLAKTFPYATAPDQNAGVDGSLSIRATSTGSFVIDWRLPVEMLKAPDITTYNPSAAASTARNTTDNTNITLDTTTGYTSSVFLNKGSTAGSENDIIRVHAVADATL